VGGGGGGGGVGGGWEGAFRKGSSSYVLHRERKRKGGNAKALDTLTIKTIRFGGEGGEIFVNFLVKGRVTGGKRAVIVITGERKEKTPNDRRELSKTNLFRR